MLRVNQLVGLFTVYFIILPDNIVDIILILELEMGGGPQDRGIPEEKVPGEDVKFIGQIIKFEFQVRMLPEL
jgi:hypothetical protein